MALHVNNHRWSVHNLLHAPYRRSPNMLNQQKHPAESEVFERIIVSFHPMDWFRVLNALF